MPRIRTTTANRLTWFASHDSCAGTAFARKAGTNSSGAIGDEAGGQVLLGLLRDCCAWLVVA